MKRWALLAAAVLYLITAVDYVSKDQKGMAFAFLCYAMANVGFAWS